MNRRDFLAMLGAVAVTDPERLLWVPGQKKIFIPTDLGPWISLNIAATRASGLLHNGLGSRFDFISVVRYTALDPICKQAYDNWAKWAYGPYRVLRLPAGEPGT
jgi:hypothetical protein